MYENYTHQALPSKRYRELLGTAICVFNSNNSFIIENILREDISKEFSWHDLIDRTSGQLKAPIRKTITEKAGSQIFDLFSNIVKKRNRIIHSFQVTAPVDGDISDDMDRQVLATKYEDGRQEYITEEFLLDFIKLNDELSRKLHDFRGF
ncbi:selenium binding protein [Providencia rettgeri]